MSAQRVLSAAAVLGEFSLDEIEAFCDEPKSVIVEVLEDAGGAVIRIRDEALGEIWQVRDVESLRAGARAHRSTDDATLADSGHDFVSMSAGTQLQYVEQTLLDSGESHSFDERRILLGTAKNHLRQVVAKALPCGPAWWDIELVPRALETWLAPETDEATRTRLQFDVEVAYLTEHDLTGRTLTTKDLVDCVTRLQPLMSRMDAQRMRDLIGRFFDLVLAQAVPSDEGNLEASGRLLAALARRRIKAQLERSLEGAMHSLVPLLTNVGRDRGDRPPGLYEVLEDLPSGRQHVVVYSDLLDMLPERFGWQRRTVRLPGALIEAFTEPDTSDHLRMFAKTLERDLHNSPYGSEPALIGSAVHVFQQLAAQSVDFDRGLPARSDRTCSELLGLARVAIR